MELLEFDVDQIQDVASVFAGRRNTQMSSSWRGDGITVGLLCDKTHRIKTEIQDVANLWLHGCHTAFTLIITLDR